jgi:hypothetical protein
MPRELETSFRCSTFHPFTRSKARSWSLRVWDTVASMRGSVLVTPSSSFLPPISIAINADGGAFVSYTLYIAVYPVDPIFVNVYCNEPHRYLSAAERISAHWVRRHLEVLALCSHLSALDMTRTRWIHSRRYPVVATSWRVACGLTPPVKNFPRDGALDRVFRYITRGLQALPFRQAPSLKLLRRFCPT